MKTRLLAILVCWSATHFFAGCSVAQDQLPQQTVKLSEGDDMKPGAPGLVVDWPQFRGPDRTGVSQEKGLLKAWPKEGPKLAWTFKDAGIGFSSVSISKGVVFTLGTDLAVKDGKALANDEFVIAIDEKNGKELWRTKIGPLFAFKGNVWGDGPRSTPTIDGGFL